MTYTKDQVVKILLQYSEIQRQLKLLRFELDRPVAVSPDEVIESLTFAHNSDEPISMNSISNKTLYIAMNYQGAISSIQDDARNDILQRIHTLECASRKIEYYLSLLSEQQRLVTEHLYFMQQPIHAVAEDLKMSIWAVRKRRDEALAKLAEMYSFVGIAIDNLFEQL